jgi:hypothetical protein
MVENFILVTNLDQDNTFYQQRRWVVNFDHKVNSNIWQQFRCYLECYLCCIRHYY